MKKHEEAAMRVWMLCHPPEQIQRTASETLAVIEDFLMRHYDPENWRVVDLPLACPHCKKLLGYNAALTEAGEQPKELKDDPIFGGDY